MTGDVDKKSEYNWLALFQAFNASFCALAELLERAGVIDQAELVAELARFKPEHDNHALVAYHAEIMRTISERVFRPMPMELAVIEGGRAAAATAD